ncbi:MAG TPA: methionyl-tRNA formyltransferase [Ktedonobacterales bacterium]
MRIVFMGTPEFAVPTLQALAERAPEGLELAGVVTRVDKPVGRGRQMIPSPVKAYALARGIPVYQPGSLRKPAAQVVLRELASDLLVVAAFGQILPSDVLVLPTHGALNVHASLLPRWRGASPIAAAILAGDNETGVTIMRMDEGLDTGPMLARRATPIGPDETTGELSGRLAHLGADLLIETLPRWIAGQIVPQPQDESQATMTTLLHKEQGRIDWRASAEQIARAVRAYTPWPGAYTTWSGQQLKVLRVRALPENDGRAPGQCFAVGAGRHIGLAVACGQGALALEVIQLQGKRAAPAEEVLRGRPALATATLGS